MQGATIGVIGDVHLFWDAHDVAWFNQSGYDLLLFVGDLAGYSQVGGLRVARSISRLTVPAMCIPGNHDGLHALQLGSEIAPRAHRLRHVFARGQKRRCDRLAQALGGVELVGYSRHRLSLSGVDLNLVVGRPHSIGGRRLACLRYLKERFSIDTMEASTGRMRTLIDACDPAPILFLAHNGPTGLGDSADSIWGCDFRKKEEDWGDRDLAEAIAYAKTQGRQVLAAVAGHMHRRTKERLQRPPQLTHDGVLYINAAEVPRHRREGESLRRHHVRLMLDGQGVHAEDIWHTGPAS